MIATPSKDGRTHFQTHRRMALNESPFKQIFQSKKPITYNLIFSHVLVVSFPHPPLFPPPRTGEPRISSDSWSQEVQLSFNRKVTDLYHWTHVNLYKKNIREEHEILFFMREG